MKNQSKNGLILLTVMTLGLVAPTMTVLQTIASAQEAAIKTNTSKFGTKEERAAELAKSALAARTEDTKALKARVLQVLKEKGVNTDKLPEEDLNNEQVTVFVQLNDDAAIKTVGAPTAKQKKDKKHIHTINKAVDGVIAKQSDTKTKVKQITGKGDSHSYGYLYNGFTTKANLKQIEEIQKLSDVKSVSVSKTFKTDDSNANDMANISQAWENSDHPTKGEKMVVAIIDSGIDVKHKDLRISSGVETALSKDAINAAITGDDETAGLGHGQYETEKVPYAYNYADRDNVVYDNGLSEYHGMHVAGIVAANGENPDNMHSIVGVAPEAQLLDMKVFSNKTKSGASSENILDAIEDSVKLGADVINMSIGSDYSAEADDPEQVAIKAASKHGVLNVIAAGNAGNFDDQDRATLGSPGVVKEALTVASVNNQYKTGSAGLTINQEKDGQKTLVVKMEPTTADAPDAVVYAHSFKSMPKADGTLTGFEAINVVVLPDRTVDTIQSDRNNFGTVQTFTKSSGTLDNYDGLDVEGKIVAIRYVPDNAHGGNIPGSDEYARNDITIKEIVANAKEKNVKGIILYGSACVAPIKDFDGHLAVGGIGFNANEVTAMNQIDIPAVRINGAASDALKKVLEEDKDAKITLSSGTVQKTGDDDDKIGTHGELSLFSSWGPTPNLEFKPEVAAPGGNIYSLKNGNTYQYMSGTSMATPFVAGSEALIIQNLKNSKNVPAGIDLVNLAKVATTNTATPNKDIDQATPVSPRRQGAGSIDVNAAINNKVFLQDSADDDGVFALKEIKDGKATFTAKLTNTDSKDHSYEYNDYGGVYTEDAKFESEYIQGIIDSNVMPERVEQPNDAIIVGASLKASKQQVTVKAGETTTVNFTLTIPADTPQEFVEGFVDFKSTDGAHDLIAPYMGYSGDFGSGSPTVSSDEIGEEAFIDANNNEHHPNENGKIAFSPNIEKAQTSAFNTAGFYAINRHYVNEYSVSIEDKDHKNLIDFSAGVNLRKSDAVYPAWSGQIYNKATGKYENAKDGEYHYVIKTKTKYQTEPEVRDVNLTVDTVAPKVKTATILQMPRDKDLPQAQELLAAGRIQEEGNYLLGEISDEVGFDKIFDLIVQTEEFSIIKRVEKGSGNKFAIKLDDSLAKVIAKMQGKQKLALGVNDSAGNYGEIETDFQSGSGVNFYNAEDQAKTTLSKGTLGYDADNNTYELIGNYTADKSDEDLYIDNQKVTPDANGDFTVKVTAPEVGNKRKIYVTNEKYTDEADAQQKAISYTELFSIAYDLTTKLSVDEKYQQYETSVPVSDFTVPCTVIRGTVSEPSLRITGHSEDAEWTDLDNSLTQNNFSRQFDTADFQADVPLYDGLNFITSTAHKYYTGLGDAREYYAIYAVHAKGETIKFDNIKTNITNNFNGQTAEAAGYNPETGEFTVTGKTNDLDLEDLIIFGNSNDSKDEKNQVTINKNGTFTYSFKIGQDEAKQIHYRYTLNGETVNKDFKISLTQSLPVLEFDNADKWTETNDGYEVWTNQDQFTLSGTAQTNKDAVAVVINGDMVAYKEYVYTGDRSAPINFSKTIDLEKSTDGTAKDTIVTLEYGDANGNEESYKGNSADKKIVVHHLKTTIAKPTVKQANSFDGKVTLKAETAKDTQVEWSADGETWNQYDAKTGIATNANATIQFRSVDKYGNTSDVVKYEVKDAHPATIAKPVLTVQQLTKKGATLQLDFAKEVTAAQKLKLKLEISLDNGRTWKVQNPSQAITLNQSKILQARVKDQTNKTSEVAAWKISLGFVPKVTKIK